MFHILWYFLFLGFSCASNFPPETQHVKSFNTLVELTSSPFWKYFLKWPNEYPENSATVYVKESESFYHIASTPQKKAWYQWKEKYQVEVTQLSLGKNVKKMSTGFFPLVSVSAEFSQSPAKVERDISNIFSISLSIETRMAYNVLVSGLTTGIGSQYSLDLSLSQGFTCRVNAGGRVQMQVSSQVHHYRNAKKRNLIYKHDNKEFIEGPWKEVSSKIDGQTHLGAMFYKKASLENFRCVTDEKFFFDASKKLWIPQK